MLRTGVRCWFRRATAQKVLLFVLLCPLVVGCGPSPMREINGLVGVPAGSFAMGNNDGDPDEMPVHEVYLDSYYIGKYEVTNAEYHTFTEDTGYRRPGSWQNGQYGEPNAPVVGVTWIESVEYCRWLRERTKMPYRLPTEAEWEKAARGPESYIYPWGDFWDPNRCNSSQFCAQRSIRQVGLFETGKSHYGAYDMAGNIWEWCSDWYAPDYYQYSPHNNPAGATNGKQKVARGGCWNDNSRYCRSTDRWPLSVTFDEPYVGFRVCVSADR